MRTSLGFTQILTAGQRVSRSSFSLSIYLSIYLSILFSCTHSTLFMLNDNKHVSQGSCNSLFPRFHPEPITVIYDTNDYLVVEYARDMGQLDEWQKQCPRLKFKKLAANNSKKLMQMVNEAKCKSFENSTLSTPCLESRYQRIKSRQCSLMRRMEIPFGRMQRKRRLVIRCLGAMS